MITEEEFLKALALRTTLLALALSFSATANDVTPRPASSSANRHLYRNLLAANITGGTAAYIYLKNTWGTPNGRFHLKHEFDDNMNLTDEASHVYVSYKLTEGFCWLFRTFRMREDRVRLISALEAALVMTLVEVPLDAFNPDQGMGLTDLLANYAGIAFAWWKMEHPSNVDLKFCVKRSPFAFDNKLLANKNEEFDNYIWWATWKPKYLWTGVGYSINHRKGEVESEYYLGVGTTLYDLVYFVDQDFAKKVKVLDSYFVSVRFRV